MADYANSALDGKNEVLFPLAIFMHVFIDYTNFLTIFVLILISNDFSL